MRQALYGACERGFKPLVKGRRHPVLSESHGRMARVNDVQLL